MKPSETPYLHVRQTKGSLFPFAVEVTGNAKALLQLRQQIDRALKDVAEYPLDDATYCDVYEEEYEAVVKRAKSREEMETPRPKPEKTEEGLPWAERARRSRERARRERGRRGARRRGRLLIGVTSAVLLDPPMTSLPRGVAPLAP